MLKGAAGCCGVLLRVRLGFVMRAWVFVALGMWLAASEPAVPPVRFDAVVTDLSGRPILDLRPGDFELRENGVVRPIGAVELRAISRGAAGDTAPIASPSDQQRAARAPGTRVFAIVLDEYHVGAGVPSERVRASLTRFVDDHIGPGDLAVVVKPLDSVTSVRFTRDKDALRASIAAFAGRKGDYAPRSRFEEQYIGHAPAAVEVARTQIVSAALREIALRLGEVTADRGVIVLVSEGFSRTPPPNFRQMRMPDLQALVRAASRFHLALYGFNPADRSADGDGQASTLEWLAAQTGGQAALDGQALDAGLRRMASDLDAYYMLTYQPAQADGRFHAVQVTAKRKDAQVRTRPGYWAPLSSELRAMIETPPAPSARRALRRSTIINAWTGVTRGADGRMRMTLTWEPRGRQQPHVVLVKAQTPRGESLFEGEIVEAGASPGRAPDLASFDAPAGRVELDMTILDVRGVVLDSDVRDVDVPDLSSRGRGPIILTPEIIRGRTAPEFRALSSDPSAAPTPSRAFTRADRLLIRVPVWDPAGGSVQVTATVTNAIGGSMRAIDRSDRPGDDRTRFELPLAWLAPGNYSILLTAKSETGESREWVRFSVR